MKTIKYLPKVTAATTEYCEISEDDLAWLHSELIRWVVQVGLLDTAHDDDIKIFRDYFWHKKMSKLLHSKSAQGPNTPCSLITGIIHNMMFKQPQQRDLTRKQMEDIEYIGLKLSQVIDITAVKFQIGFTHE